MWRNALHTDYNVSISVNELHTLLQAPEAADAAFEKELHALARFIFLESSTQTGKLPSTIQETYSQ